jgi:hypothetical protein
MILLFCNILYIIYEWNFISCFIDSIRGSSFEAYQVCDMYFVILYPDDTWISFWVLLCWIVWLWYFGVLCVYVLRCAITFIKAWSLNFHVQKSGGKVEIHSCKMASGRFGRENWGKSRREEKQTSTVVPTRVDLSSISKCSRDLHHGL